MQTYTLEHSNVM